MTTASTIRQRWLAGHGPIVHGDETVERMEILLTRLIAEGRVADETTAYTLLAAAVLGQHFTHVADGHDRREILGLVVRRTVVTGKQGRGRSRQGNTNQCTGQFFHLNFHMSKNII